MHLGYEPSRITNLTQQSRAAVGALDDIHSTDPAAADAMTAIAALKGVIAERFIPSTIVVGIMDPLGGGPPVASPATALRDFEHTPWDAMSGGADPNPYRTMSDDELFEELERLQYEGLPVDEDGHPDMNDPFWTEFEPLAAELARRSESDDSFADQFALLASELVLIPFAAAFAEFDPSVVADMVVDVFQRPQWLTNIDNNYRADGAQLLLEFLTTHPEIALETLADPVNHHGAEVPLLEQLLLWPLLDEQVVTEFLDVALAAPFAPPQHKGLLLTAGKVLQDMVGLANGELFPDGFGPEVSPTIAQIIVQYLPFYATSLEGNVHLRGFDFRDLGIRLGGHEEVVDLFGALMRDPTAIIVLQQAIMMLSVLSIENVTPLEITKEDIANYSLLLREAAENEQVEEALEEAADQKIADIAIDLTLGAIDRITTAIGPAKAGADIPFDLIASGAQAFADWAITETDLGLDAIPTITAMLVIMGMAAVVLRKPSDADTDAETDAETIANTRLANEIMHDIEDDLASGKSLESIEGQVENLGRVISEIDSDVGSFLDKPSVGLPEYDAEAEADQE